MLSRTNFSNIIRDTPLISIDLLIQDETGRLLFGLRTNAPARDFWFVPGGRVRKDETLEQAFERLCFDEIGLRHQRLDSAAFLGVYEHFYSDNALNEKGFGTHYVVLGYQLQVDRASLKLPKQQHQAYRWLSVNEAATDKAVHAYSRAYLMDL